MKTIRLKSTDLVQSKEQCNFPYAHVYIKKLLHTPTGLFVIGNHVRGKQSSKSYMELRNDLVAKITEAAELIGKDYLDSLITTTNSDDKTGIDNTIASAWYIKIKQAEAAGEGADE